MKKQEKPKYVEQLAGMINDYSVIGVLNMHKMPARALQQMRESMRSSTVIKMGKKNLITKALNSSKKNVKDLQQKLA